MNDKDREFVEKIKTIGVSLRRGTSEKKPVINEYNGKVGGYHVEHWDDSQDAVIKPNSINIKTTLQKEE